MAKKIYLSGTEVTLPDNFELHGRLSATPLFANRSIEKERLIIGKPTLMAEYDMAVESLLVSLNLLLGIYTPDFENGGGI